MWGSRCLRSAWTIVFHHVQGDFALIFQGVEAWADIVFSCVVGNMQFWFLHKASRTAGPLASRRCRETQGLTSFKAARVIVRPDSEGCSEFMAFCL